MQRIIFFKQILEKMNGLGEIFIRNLRSDVDMPSRTNSTTKVSSLPPTHAHAPSAIGSAHFAPGHHVAV